MSAITAVSTSITRARTNTHTYTYIHTQADKGDQTGFDIILEKHLNGKAVMKDIAEFTRERSPACLCLMSCFDICSKYI